MKTGLGPILRMVGLLIEVGSAGLILWLRSKPRSPGLMRLEPWLFGGLVVGLAVWAASIALGAWGRPTDVGRRGR